MTVYQFLYTDCIHESGAITMGLYFQKKEAYHAMKEHMLDEYTRWLNHSKAFRRSIKFGKFQRWQIAETKIQGNPSPLSFCYITPSGLKFV